MARNAFEVMSSSNLVGAWDRRVFSLFGSLYIASRRKWSRALDEGSTIPRPRRN